MSYQAMAWATSIRLPITEKMVLLMLANRASHDDGSCYPSLKRVADECGLHRTTVIRAIQRLEEKGFLKVYRSKKSNEENNLNKYFLSLWGSVTESLGGSSAELLGSSAELLGSSAELLGGSSTERPKPINSLTNQLTSQLIKDKQQPKKAKSIEKIMLLDYGLDEQLADDFLTLRKSKRAPVTKTVCKSIQTEAEKAGILFSQAIEICINRSWQSFNASWDWQCRKQTNGTTYKTKEQLRQEGTDKARAAFLASFKTIDGEVMK
jgi:biotin operon repressor